MTRAYYKTNAAEVLAALHLHNEESRAVQAAGKLFADHFGGTLLTQAGIHSYRVAGLAFEPKRDGRLWTLADPKMANMQRPRASITGATLEEKAALAVLKADWKARFPMQESSFAPVMAAMGTDWGVCAFNGGFALFEHDGFVYVATGAKLAACMIEIMASEYSAAREQFDAAKRKAVQP